MLTKARPKIYLTRYFLLNSVKTSVYSEFAIYEAATGFFFCPQVLLSIEDTDLCLLGVPEGPKSVLVL